MLARIVDNKFIYLANLTVHEEDLVQEHFSVEIKNYQYIDPSQRGGWNGIYRRYDRGKQRLARPFLGELRLLCKKRNIPLVVQDERPVWPHQVTPPEQIDKNFLPGITLEDYQVAAIQKGCGIEVGIISAPMGSGKSELIAGFCKAINCLTIILADQLIIIDQLKERLELREVINDVGLFYAGQTPAGQSIIIGSIQSLVLPARIPSKPSRYDYKSDEGYGRALKKHEATLQGFRKRSARAKQFQELVKKSEMLIVDECVDENAFITTDRGLIRAADLFEMVKQKDNVNILLADKKFKIIACAEKFDKALSLQTHTDRRLTASPNHSFAVLDNCKGQCVFRKASELQIGDLLFVRNLKPTKHIECDPFWYDLGLFIGDGHLLNNVQTKFGIRRDFKDWTRAVKAIAQRWNGYFTYSCNNRGDHVFRLKAPRFREWLGKLGFSPGRKMGNINPKFAIPNLEAAAGLVRGLFDTDGTSYSNRATFDSSDRPLTAFCQLLLSYLGINSSMFISRHGTSKHKDLWRVLVSGRNFEIFRDLIGFGFQRKRSRADHNYRAKNRNTGLIPVSKLLKFWQSAGLPVTRLASCLGVLSSCLSNPSRINLERLLEWQKKLSDLASIKVCDYNEARRLFGISDRKVAQHFGLATVTLWKRRKKGDNKPWRGLISYIQKQIRERLKSCQLPSGYTIERLESKIKVKRQRLIDFSIKKASCFEANSILVHNCDLASSNQFRYVFRHLFSGRRRYGFSGTPNDPAKPLQNLFVKEHLGSVIFEVDRREVEKLGRIIPVEYFMFSMGEDGNIHESSAYDIAMTEKMIENPIFHKAVAAICDTYPNDGTLILVDRDNLGEALQAIIPGSVFIHGQTPQRRRNQVLDAFERRELKVLIGGKIIRRGLDLKGGCENLIIATGGKLWSTFNQQVGRAVRINQCKRARVFDFYFLNNKYLYSHSKSRLRAMVGLGYKTRVVFRDGQQLDGEQFVNSRFRRPKRRPSQLSFF